MGEKIKVQTIVSNQLDDESSIKESSSISNDGVETFWQKIVRICQVQEKGDLTTQQMFLYNYDLRPVEEERRTWSWFNYVFFWIADSFNINTWQIAATGVENGMTWWQTWLSV